MKILISEIQVGDRFRQFSMGVAQAIAASFKSEGQFTPIAVSGNRLVAGRHRLEAAKLCGWTHVDAKALDFSHLNEEQAEVECQIIEVAENLMRGSLDQADSVRHVDKYAELANRRVHMAELKEKNAALEAANKARAAALAKLNAEKDEKEKARLKAAFDKAEQARKNADKRRADEEENARQFSVANENKRALRLKKGATEEAAKQTGLKPTVIRQAHYYVKALGKDTLELIANTPLSTQAEMNALIALLKRYPKEAEKVLRSVRFSKEHKTGAVMSPSGILGAIIKEEKAAGQQKLWKTTEGQLAECIKLLAAAELSVKQARGFWSRLPENMRAKTREYEQLATNLANVTRVLRAFARPLDQKRTGNEHQYATEKPKETKDEVRASLGKLRKPIAKSVASKANGQKHA